MHSHHIKQSFGILLFLATALLLQGTDYRVTADPASVYDGDTKLSEIPKGTKFSSIQTQGEWVMIPYTGANGESLQGWISMHDIEEDTLSYDQSIHSKHIIYIYRFGREKGPFSLGEIERMIQSGEYTLENEARIAGEEERSPLHVIYSRMESGTLQAPPPQKKNTAKKALIGLANVIAGGANQTSDYMGKYGKVRTAERGTKLKLYGGPEQLRYLGCLNCDKSDEDSVWNRSGKYGSLTGKYSIWNEKGLYGSKYKEYSPWKKIADHPPIIIDKDRSFFGVFTINKVTNGRAKMGWIRWIIDNPDLAREHFDELAKDFDGNLFNE